MSDKSEDKEERKKIFEEEIMRLNSNKGFNSTTMTNAQYQAMIKEVKRAKIAISKTPAQYRRLKRFDIRIYDGKERLVTAQAKSDDELRFFVSLDEVFDIIEETHLAMKHAGKNKMMVQLKKTYKNVTQESVIVYLNHCKSCQQNHYKKSYSKKGLAYLKDVLDLSHSNNKYILYYWDAQTKIYQIRPMENNDMASVAETLSDIFATVGFPTEICTENEKFTIKAIEQLNQMSQTNIIPSNSDEDFTNLHDIHEEVITHFTESGIDGDIVRVCKLVQMKRNNTTRDHKRRELSQSTLQIENVQTLDYDSLVEDNTDDPMTKWFFLERDVLEKLLEGIWIVFDEQRFIEEVNRRPGLWNPDARSNFTREDIEAFWTEIAQIMLPCWDKLQEYEKSSAVKSFKAKWRTILDIQKKYLLMKSKNYDCYANYELPAELSFMETYLYVPDLDTMDEGPLAKRPRIEPAQVSCTSSKLQERMYRLLETMNERDSKRWQDEDILFFQSLLPTLKQMPMTAKFKTKIDIMKLISENSVERRAKRNNLEFDLKIENIDEDSNS